MDIHAFHFDGPNSDSLGRIAAEGRVRRIAIFRPMTAQNRRFKLARLRRIGAITLLLVAALPLSGKQKTAIDYGTGLIVNIPLPEAEVAPVVSEVAQNGIIRGTKEYNKDEYISGAESAASSNVFPTRSEGGKVFYKVRKEALDPRNFKDSGDVGTIAVRYAVEAEGEKNTVLRIDAIFVDDFHHSAHPSNGSVENSEYKSIQEHLEALELMKKQAAEAEMERQERLARKNFEAGASSAAATPVDVGRSSPASTATVADLMKAEPPPAVGPRAGESLQEYAAELRREVERRVKFPGAALKAAPFHSASTAKNLPSGTEVLIVISTPYWFGVETRDGQHGWLSREQLEELP